MHDEMYQLKVKVIAELKTITSLQLEVDFAPAIGFEHTLKYHSANG